MKLLPLSSHLTKDNSQRLALAAGGAALLGLAGKRRSFDGLALGLLGACLLYRGATGRSILPSGFLQFFGVPRLGLFPGPAVRMHQSITVNRPASVMFDLWRRLENLPCFISHLRAVTELDEKRSHWVGLGTSDQEVEWYAEIVQEEPHRLISWKSLPGGDVKAFGSVEFRPGADDDSTEIKVTMQFRASRRVSSDLLRGMLGDHPEQRLGEDLVRFKELAENGEVEIELESAPREMG